MRAFLIFNIVSIYIIIGHAVQLEHLFLSLYFCNTAFYAHNNITIIHIHHSCRICNKVIICPVISLFLEWEHVQAAETYSLTSSKASVVHRNLPLVSKVNHLACVRSSTCIVDRLAYRLATPAGSCSASSMVSVRTVKWCHRRALTMERMHSIPSSARLVLVNTSPDVSLQILNLPSLTRFGMVHIVNYIIWINCSLVKKIQPIIMLEVITLLVKRKLMRF